MHQVGARARAWGVGLCLLVSHALAPAAPPPVEAFFADPVLSGATLSPDGRHVAVLSRTQAGTLALAVVDLATQKAQAIAGSNERDVSTVYWVNDRRLVYRLRSRYIRPGESNGGPGLFGVDLDGGQPRQLMESWFYSVRTAEMGVPPLKPDHIIIPPAGHGSGDFMYVAQVGEASQRRVGYFTLKRLNTVNGRVEEIETPLHGQHWLIGNNGQPVVQYTQHDGKAHWEFRQPDGSWRAGRSFDPFVQGGQSVSFVAPDGRFYGSAAHQGFDAPFEFDPETGQPKGKPLVAVPGFSLHPHYIADERKLLGLRFVADAEVTYWLDADMKALQAHIDQLLPATSNRISVPHHGDSPWVLVQALADVQPTVTYVFHRQTKKLLRLGTALPQIDAKAMGQTDFHRIPARDGLPLPAYLTLPPGGGKNLPLVLLVHGGPWARGGHWSFDPEVQFLATRGYAVLQVEFRGSTGFGRKHLEAGFRQWGLAMQDDLVDAVRWAVAQGHADPQRVCIAGGSYGGYATLMGLVKDGDVFRCGVAWVAVTDPALLLDKNWSDITGEAREYGLTRLIGDPAREPEKFKAASAVERAAEIRQPLLLAYGRADHRVPLVHGERLKKALEPHNPNVQWVVYELEGHGWAHPETRKDFWTRVEKFLAQHLARP